MQQDFQYSRQTVITWHFFWLKEILFYKADRLKKDLDFFACRYHPTFLLEKNIW